MAGRRCRALSCWALALTSFASFLILYKAPWQIKLQPKDIVEKNLATKDRDVLAENSAKLEHLERSLDYNDEMVEDSNADDDEEQDYDEEGDLDQTRKKTKKMKVKVTDEEKQERRLRRLFDFDEIVDSITDDDQELDYDEEEEEIGKKKRKCKVKKAAEEKANALFEETC